MAFKYAHDHSAGSPVVARRWQVISSLVILITTAFVIFAAYRNENDSLTSYRGSINVSQETVDTAWSDLQEISTRPHSYNSVEHERVRQYLVHRLRNISASVSHGQFAQVIEHNEGHVFTKDHGGQQAYFEGENIYAVVEGTLPDKAGVLVSGHYDSVSTSFGTSDDGVAIVTLLALFEHFLLHRPSRTVVFNFNSGEEYMLLGASQFTHHYLAKKVEYFLNLEGAGAGYKTAMFRASSYGALKALSGAPSTSGNVIMQDMFAQRVIKSDTDYSVYDVFGLKGLDMAYYKPRSRYHTPQDSIKSTSPNAVKYMLDNAVNIVTKLSSIETDDVAEDNTGVGVFFDILGAYVFVLKLETLTKISLTFVILNPVLIGYLVYELAKSEKRFKLRLVSLLKLPILLVTLALTNLALINIISKINRDSIYASDVPVFAIGSVLLLTSFSVYAGLEKLWPSNSSIYQILELWITFWILSIAGVVSQLKLKLGGSYIVVIEFTAVTAATGIGLLNLLNSENVASVSETIELSSAVNETQAAERQDQEQQVDEEVEDSAAEDAPLLADLSSYALPGTKLDNTVNEEILNLVQYFLLVPIPVLLLLQIGFNSVESLRYGVADGSPHILPYASIAVIFSLAIVHLSPFIPKFIRSGILSTSVVVLWIFGTILLLSYTFTAPAFNEKTKLKLFYEHTINVTAPGYVDETKVLGIPPYVEQVIRGLPSGKSGQVDCEPFGELGVLNECTYPGPSPGLFIGPGQPHEWTKASVIQESPSSYVITISGHNTRGAYVTLPKSLLNETGPLEYEVLSSQTIAKVDNAKILGKFHSFELWSRCSLVNSDCFSPFVLRISSPNGVAFGVDGITAGSQWDGWIPGSPETSARPGRLPSLDELYHYIPSWVTFQKKSHGLVRVFKNLSL
ncbi:hypothetical protein V1514DRAFT_294775 [Lipomyces japonicus]|uniref:uncharacterized protein n=1 Tax=Lipomyces japonicus TaxID=56871 RepID=UPI0034CDAAF2